MVVKKKKKNLLPLCFKAGVCVFSLHVSTKWCKALKIGAASLHMKVGAPAAEDEIFVHVLVNFGGECEDNLTPRHRHTRRHMGL